MISQSCSNQLKQGSGRKVKTVKTKKYGREAMTNNAVSSWNNIQKIFPSHVLRDLSYSRLKSLLVKYFLKSYSNNA